MTRHNGHAPEPPDDLLSLANDERLQRLRRFAHARHDEGNAARWRLAFIAGAVVGAYTRGATYLIARDNRVSEDLIEMLARGARCYRDFTGRNGDGGLVFRKLSELRRVLNPRHFAVMGRLIRRYDMELSTAYQELLNAANDGLSPEAMAANVVQSESDGADAPARSWSGEVTRNTRRRGLLVSSVIRWKPGQDEITVGSSVKVREVESE